MPTLTKDKVKTILGTSPGLSNAAVGRLLNISRQRVQQSLQGMPELQYRRKRFCKMCSQRLRIVNYEHKYSYKEGYCPECWPIEKARRSGRHFIIFRCEVCGAPFSRKRSEVKYRVRVGRGLPRFCGHQHEALSVFHGVRYKDARQ